MYFSVLGAQFFENFRVIIDTYRTFSIANIEYYHSFHFVNVILLHPLNLPLKKSKLYFAEVIYQQSLNCKVDEPIPNLHFKHCQNVHKYTFMLFANHIVYTLSFGTESYLLACWLGLDRNVTLPNLLQYPDPVWWIWIMFDFFE